MDLKVACSKVRKEFVLNTKYDKAVAILLEFCEAVLEAKDMPQDKKYPHDNTGNNECYLCSEVRGYNQANAEWLAYYSKIMSGINAEVVKDVLDNWDIEEKLDEIDKHDIAAAIVAGLKEGK